MPREQWVNLPPERGELVERGVHDAGELGPTVTIRGSVAEARPARLRMLVESDGENAEYHPSERRVRRDVTGSVRAETRVTAASDGSFSHDLVVSQAGGDRYTVRVEDEHGTSIALEEIHTRRRLYYQVIRMEGTTALGDGDFADMEAGFWSEANKTYIQFVRLPSATIPARVSLDISSHVHMSALHADLARVRDASRDPYTVLVVVARRLAAQRDHDGTRTIQWGQRDAVENPATTVPTPQEWQTRVTFDDEGALADFSDPDAEWYVSLSYSHGRDTGVIERARCTRVDRRTIDIDHRGYGPSGGGDVTLHYSLHFAHPHGGVSISDTNIIMVAGESSFSLRPLPSQATRSTLMHEIGHRIGMVPRARSARIPVDAQDSYYEDRGHQGPHCECGASYDDGAWSGHPTCAMYGTVAPNIWSFEFCPACRTSLRKLDLRSSYNPAWEAGIDALLTR